MTSFALNHMTVARLTFVQLLDLAVELGCIGIEVRNDLPQPLFDGLDPAAAGAMARDKGSARARSEKFMRLLFQQYQSPRRHHANREGQKARGCLATRVIREAS